MLKRSKQCISYTVTKCEYSGSSSRSAVASS